MDNNSKILEQLQIHEEEPPSEQSAPTMMAESIDEAKALQRVDFEYWYPRLAKHSLKSVVIDVPPLFVEEYLMRDGILKPESIYDQKYVQSDSDDDDQSSSSSSSSEEEEDEDKEVVPKAAKAAKAEPVITPEEQAKRDEYLAICQDLREKIDAVLDTAEGANGGQSFGTNGAFVKLNEKAATDSNWMNHDLCCPHSEDVFQILKASTRIGTHLRKLRESEQPMKIILRKFYQLNKAMEFRVFVKNGVLVGISQRDYTVQHNFLQQNDTQLECKMPDGSKAMRSVSEIVIEKARYIKSQIEEAFKEEGGGPNPQNCYSFDIYLGKVPTFKVKLIDINGWQLAGKQGDSQLNPLLFKWYQLNAMNTEGDVEVEFRVTQAQNGMFVQDSAQESNMMMPEDFQNLKEFKDFMEKTSVKQKGK